MEADTRLVRWDDYEKWPWVSVCELVNCSGSCMLFCGCMHEYIVGVLLKREKERSGGEREKERREKR